MSSKPLRPCRHPGCLGLTREVYCEQHKSERFARDKHRGSAAERGYDSRWNKYSDAYKRSHPLCALCEAEGRTTAVDIVHHINPVSEGNAVLAGDDGLLPVCVQCHPRVEGLGREWRKAIRNATT
jgi:5-methylcytosine-specific restriction enzyme A